MLPRGAVNECVRDSRAPRRLEVGGVVDDGVIAPSALRRLLILFDPMPMWHIHSRNGPRVGDRSPSLLREVAQLGGQRRVRDDRGGGVIGIRMIVVPDGVDDVASSTPRSVHARWKPALTVGAAERLTSIAVRGTQRAPVRGRPRLPCRSARGAAAGSADPDQAEPASRRG